jgi:hypothetical protein
MSNFKLGSVVGVGCAFALIIGLVVGVIIAPNGSSNAGGSVHNTQEAFSSGLLAGTANDLSVDSSGNLTTTGTAAITGETRAPLVELGSLTTLAATSTATTLTAAQVCNSNVIEWDVTTTSSTLTLPTAANLVADCLTANGDQIEFIFDATSASTTIVTITTGSGIELIGSASTDDLIDNGNQARVTLWRTSASAVLGEVEELVAAD